MGQSDLTAPVQRPAPAELVVALRDGRSPPGDAADRVWAAMQTRMDAEALPPPLARGPIIRSLKGLVGGLVVVMGLGLAVRFQMLAAEPRPAAAVSSSVRTTVHGARASSRRYDPGLAENDALLNTRLTLLRDAQQAVERGDGPAALELLQTSAGLFSDGSLRAEYTLARVKALCSVGEEIRARTLANHFVARYPGSIYVNYFRGLCAGNGSQVVAK